MSRKSKVAFWVAGSVAGLIAVALVAAFVLVRSPRFQNYVREKIISEVEAATGGKVELSTFVFDPRGLTVTATHFVIHGTEPPGSAPLFVAPSLVLRLKLFTKRLVDLEYLGVDRPSANIIVFPNGDTNLPTPAVRKRSNHSTLETVVDLAIHRIDVRNGSVHFQQQEIPVEIHGSNLILELAYQASGARYEGQFSMNPLRAESGNRAPVEARLVIPIQLERDRIQVNQARFDTPQSHITVTGAIAHLAAPEISGQLAAHLDLAELSRSLVIPLRAGGGAPRSLDASLSIQSDSHSSRLESASVILGASRVDASGDLKTGADFHAALSLTELTGLFTSPEPLSGLVQLSGKLSLPSNPAYRVTGTLEAHDISLRDRTMRLTGLQLSSSFNVDPSVIAVNNLRLRALGGEVVVNGQVESLAAVNIRGELKGFGIQTLVSSLLSKSTTYSGSISGSVEAHGDLKSLGSGLRAQAHLAIAPGASGTPVGGRINASYDGKSRLLSFADTAVTLPNSRIDITGQPGSKAELRGTSRNLNDFAPAMALLSSEPQHIPLNFRGGVGTIVVDEFGPLSEAELSGNVQLTRFAIGPRTFDELKAGFTASPSRAVLQDGILLKGTSQALFNGSIGLKDWAANAAAPIVAAATIRNAEMSDMLALAGDADLPLTGQLNADVHVTGTVSNPQGTAQTSIDHGSAYDQPFEHFNTQLAFSDQLVTLQSLELSTTAGSLTGRGTFTHPRDSFETGRIQAQLASTQVQLAQLQSLQKRRSGLAGEVSLKADLLVDVKQTNGSTTFMPTAVNANVTARGLRDSRLEYGDVTAVATTYGTSLNTVVDSDFAGSTIRLSATTALAAGFESTGDASVKDLQIQKALALFSADSIRVSGLLAASAHFNGTMEDPHASVTFTIADAMAYQEPVQGIRGSLAYSPHLVAIPGLDVASNAGTIHAEGSYSHPGDLNSGKAELRVSIPGLDLQKIKNLQNRNPGLSGTARLTANLSAAVEDHNGHREILPLNIETAGSLQDVALDHQRLGNVTLQGNTQSNVFNMKLDSDFAGSSVHGTGRAQLQGNYPADAQVSFTHVTYSGLQAFIPASLPDGFDALLEGSLSFKGPARNPETGTGDLTISRLELSTAPTVASASTRVITLQNQGPIVARLNQSEVRIEDARFTGPSVNAEVKGSAPLDNTTPMSFSVNAGVGMAFLKTFFPDAYTGGSIALNATVRGLLSQPLVNGRVDLKQASLQLSNWPNGITNANGVINLTGTSARIESLTAEAGGGKISVTGSAGSSGTLFSFDLRATARQIRTRYGGASVTSNASLTMSGTSQHSVLGGTVTISRVGYSQESDIGSILTGAASPPRVSSVSSGPLAGMRLNVRIQTSPDVRFQTSLAQELSATADMTLHGEVVSPGMVGRIDITGGTLVFFGNKYTVNRGSVSFYNATAIDPILDIDLQTLVQGVDVDLGVSGPIDNLKLTYRSDPPLKFEDIVALLATGKTPPDPTIAINQPYSPDQSATQMGESALLGQAVANPLASRLQRVFGISQLVIAPTFVQGATLPQARVTIQQQVSNSVTFTFSQDLSMANSELIRVEFALTPRFSAVATRDENGIFGVDFFYKKQFK